jgi:hypothetical protein
MKVMTPDNICTFYPRSPRYELRSKARSAVVEASNGNVRGGPIEAWIENVSGKGFFLLLDRHLEPGVYLRLKMALPAPGVPEQLLLDCRCRVVRTAKHPSGRIAVGAVIDQYDFSRQRA